GAVAVLRPGAEPARDRRGARGHRIARLPDPQPGHQPAAQPVARAAVMARTAGRAFGSIVAIASAAVAVISPAVAASPLMHTNFGGDSRHAWTASVSAPALYGRGVRALSAPILPSGYLAQAEGVITAVRWRYRFARVPPPNLQAYLCN